ncbi:MAG: cation:proton antiporter [Candidatus Nanoarchaeia archaeon]
MESIFLQISVSFLIVLAVSFIIKILRQPLIIGYILSGIAIGPFLFNLLPNTQTLQIFSEFGIAFLLFIVGINLNPKTIKEVGKISLITGIGQVIFTSLIGYFIGIMIGFSPVTSLYIAIALTFSSTIIIMKLLSDKDALDKLFGKISIGFLLVQDLIAIIILIVVSSLSNGENAARLIISTLVKGTVIFAILFPISYFVLPRLSNFFAKSQELLFVFSISWGLGLSALFLYSGFSIEVGALIAGILLSMSPYSFEISSKLRPLRDFFIISFFILLGAQMVFSDISHLWVPAIIFSLFILIGNPIIVMVLMGIFGYSKNTGFMAGLTVAQISEFSLILISLGVKAGHLTSEVLSFVTIVGLITIAGSTYMIMYSDQMYRFLSRYLSIFERKNIKKEKDDKVHYEYILLGENRIGFSIMKSFISLKKKYLVVDFNPERVKRLNSKGIKCIYGDASNADFLEDLRIDKAKIIVSTIPEIEINMMIIEKIREKNKNTVIIVNSRQISDTYALYKAGADYVIMPHFLGGDYTAKLIEKAKENKAFYAQEKEKQLKELKERIKEGHEHPKIERDGQANN